VGASYFLEKQSVIIDFGAAYTKVGFATESRPRHIVPTPELRVRGQSGKGLTKTASEEQWVDVLDKLLHKLFFHYLSVSPKDRRVVICDSIYSPVQFRNALATVLFKRFNVPSASFVADLVLPLYLTGLSSGIVVDCGFRSSRVLATFAGVPLISAYRTATVGGQLVSSTLFKEVKASLGREVSAATANWLDSPGAPEDLMVRTSYVSFKPPGETDPSKMLHSTEPLTLRVDKGGSVVVSAASRWQPCERFFTSPEGAGSGARDYGPVDPGACEGCHCDTLPEAFLQALEACPVDVCAAVVQNIVVVGGCATIRGLLPRLALEIHTALKRIPKMAALADRLRFTPLDFSPVCAAWAGGAVFGSLEGAGDYTAADFQAGKPLPDWSRDGFV